MARKTKKVKANKSSKQPSRKPIIAELDSPASISFDYIKSNFFRVVRVDGAYGGIGPKANTIQMALFSERQAIPKKETYTVKKGRLADLQSKEGRDAIIREVEIEAIVDIDTAKVIREWLDNKIQTLEQIRQEIK